MLLDPGAASTAAVMAATNSAPTATEAAVLPTCEKAVTNCPTAFWLLVEGAAKAEEATTAIATLLGAAGAAAALQPVAAVAAGAAAPAEMLAAVVAERKTLAEQVAAVVRALQGTANRGATGPFTKAATAARGARVVAVTVVTTEVVEAAGAAITAVAAAARAVVLRATAALAVARRT